jgi:hypothetical protein
MHIVIGIGIAKTAILDTATTSHFLKHVIGGEFSRAWDVPVPHAQIWYLPDDPPLILFSNFSHRIKPKTTQTISPTQRRRQDLSCWLHLQYPSVHGDPFASVSSARSYERCANCLPGATLLCRWLGGVGD